MGHQANSFRPSSRASRRGAARAIATALIAREDRLLLLQLARGRFAGYWLLPSATVEEHSLAETARRLAPERAGYATAESRLLGVLEEPRAEVLALRFAFAVEIAGERCETDDTEIAQCAWFARDAVREMLEERDVTPTLGVMSLVRSWAEGSALPPLTTLDVEMPCPCGSGFSYHGCCGWDMR